MSKVFVFLSIVIFIFACANGESEDKKPVFDEFKYGAKVFQKNCVLCHGIDGKLEFNGAKDINQSTLSLEERIVLITNGRKTMTPFKGVLTKKQIKAVAAYTLKMKNK